MIKRNSIRTTLTVTLVVSLTIMFLLFWWVVSNALHELTANYLEDRMELEIASILAELALNEADTIILNNEHVDALFHFSFSGYYFQITFEGQGTSQILHSKSLGAFTLTLPTLPTGSKTRFFTKGPKNENLFVLIQTIPLREKKLTIAVAEDLTPIENDLNDFQRLYGFVSLFFLGLLTWIHVIAVQRAILPLLRIHQDVIQLEMGKIGKLTSDVPEEMQKVVEKINRLLLRMEQRLVRSRSTISNLAHAIKSPFAAFSQIIHHPILAQEPELREDLEQRITSINALVERELRRARLADYPLLGEFFCPEQSLGSLVRALKNINFQKKIEVDLDLSPGMLLPFDQEDMMEIFGNLLDNAFKWANSRISVTLEELVTTTKFCVEDDGPGIDLKQSRLLLQRGVRFDEARLGHGLGLTIVNEIVEHYSGTIHFTRSSTLGGFRVDVELPLPNHQQITHA